MTVPWNGRYGRWAGNPKGEAEDLSRCREEVRSGGRFPMYNQCARKRGHGIGGQFCKQHAKMKETI